MPRSTRDIERDEGLLRCTSCKEMVKPQLRRRKPWEVPEVIRPYYCPRCGCTCFESGKAVRWSGLWQYPKSIQGAA